jgi:guanylate kinase
MDSDTSFNLPARTPLLIIISGPAGAGKDTVVRTMMKRSRSFHFVVTATTREQRPDEVEGKDYFFVSEAEFDRMVDADELLEHTRVYKQNKGIPRAQVQEALASGKDVVMRLDVQGAATVHSLERDALMIFVTVESEQALERRLRERKTDTEDQIAVRMATAREEMKRIGEYDYVVINRDDHPDEAVDTLEAIIRAEHARVVPRKVQL